MFTLHTSRLTLRDLEEADWPGIFALSREPAVTRYQTWLRLDTEEQARRWVQEAAEHNRRQPRRAYNLAILQGERTVGWLGFGRTPEPSPRAFEFGYALLPSAWGQAYMTETLEAALTFMFGSLGADLVAGECERSNTASVRVMEKAGLRLVHTRSEEEADRAREICRFVMDRPAWRLARSPRLPEP